MIQFFNPLTYLIQAVENLYGEQTCTIQFGPIELNDSDTSPAKTSDPTADTDVESEDVPKPLGETTEDENGFILITLDHDLTLTGMIHGLAQELALVVCSRPEHEYVDEEAFNDRWDEIQRAIFAEYQKVMDDALDAYANDVAYTAALATTRGEGFRGKTVEGPDQLKGLVKLD